MRPISNRSGITIALILALAACATPPSRIEGDPASDRRSEPESTTGVVEPADIGADRSADVVMLAIQLVDLPYLPGGQQSATGFDCSGFTRHVFEQSLGVLLPRQADEQARAPALQAVRREQLRPGDLVFFNTLGRKYSHVGIYIGEGRFIHAPRSGTRIRLESLTADYWARRFTGARRAAVRTQTQDPEIAG